MTGRDRGVSVTLNYVLGLAVATLLITGLIYGIGSAIDTRQESTTRSELRVIGEQVASDLMTADRLVQAGQTSPDELVIEVSGPDRVADREYFVELNATTETVAVETMDPAVTVKVSVHSRTQIATSRAEGGDVRIVLVDDGGTDTLEVRSS